MSLSFEFLFWRLVGDAEHAGGCSGWWWVAVAGGGRVVVVGGQFGRAGGRCEVQACRHGPGVQV